MSYLGQRKQKSRTDFCFKDVTPELFEQWFRHVYETFVQFSKDENFIFINAWNEWAEGCHLEPYLKYGKGGLEGIKRVKERSIDKC